MRHIALEASAVSSNHAETIPRSWTVEKLDGGYKIIRRQRTVARLCLCVMPTRVMAVAKAATYISERCNPKDHTHE